MNLTYVQKMQADKDHLMRHEGKHPANRDRYNQFLGGDDGADPSQKEPLG